MATKTAETKDLKDVVSGYAGLDGTTLVLAAELGTSTPTGAKYLRGDRKWSDAVEVLTTVLADKISPAQITSDQNDYNPASLSTVNVLRINTDASRNITGLAGGVDGRLLFWWNVGSFNSILVNESASSSAANRFAFVNDLLLVPNEGALLRYDGVSSRWRLVGEPIPLTTAGDTLVFGATMPTRKAIGSEGQWLMVEGAQADKLRYGALAGLLWRTTLSNNAGDATNDIDIAAGEFSSDDANYYDCVVMRIAGLTKRLDAAWVVGTNQGSLDIGTIANGTYHVWGIMRPDTAIVDALFSRNPGVAATITVTIATPAVVTWTGHGLQAGSTVVFTTTGALPTGITAGTRYFVIAAGLTAGAFQISATEGGAAINTSGTQSGVHTGTAGPVMPTSYTKKRRIGSILREAAAIVAFSQTGDEFARLALANDIGVTNPGAAAVTATLSVPTGIKVDAIITANLQDTAAGNKVVRFSDLATMDVATTISNSMLTMASAGTSGSWRGTIRTNTSAQIRYRLDASGANTVLNGQTLGWVDTRGTMS